MKFTVFHFLQNKLEISYHFLNLGSYRPLEGGSRNVRVLHCHSEEWARGAASGIWYLGMKDTHIEPLSPRCQQYSLWNIMKVRPTVFTSSFLNFYFWLCWVFVGEAGFSLVVGSRAYSSCSEWVSHCGGISYGTWALGCVGFSSCCTVSLEHRLSSWGIRT